MITRLKVDGFKNLVNVDLHFGPFTCIAGTNAVGKSNLFDAIRFLSDLTSKTLLEAAISVRSEGHRNSDIKEIFHKVGSNYSDKINFEIEMIIPKEGIDHLGQMAKASITTLKYELVIKYRKEDNQLEVVKEELIPITLTEARKTIYFAAIPKWIKSVMSGRRSTKSPFISTLSNELNTVIKLHQDQNGGKSQDRKSSTLPRTVLSSTDAQTPTALLAKNEMQSWQMLQLEPSALRESDEFHTIKNAKLGADGAHLAATLFRLNGELDKNKFSSNIYQQLASRLSELVHNVSSIDIEKDEKRELLTLILKDKNGTSHPARSLSDGTLRFLGLAVLELDYKSSGVICMEEPENGIHPEKIKSVLKLLQDICTDTTYEVGIENPLRQVIINTHSPVVVQQVPEDSLLLAESQEGILDGKRYNKVTFSPLVGTWRNSIPEINSKEIKLGNILAYLNPTEIEDDETFKIPNKKNKILRVIDRSEIRQLFFNFSKNE
jgi:predicted ATPase